ncbi:CAP domain-containing protein [Spirochaetota bacterium]
MKKIKIMKIILMVLVIIPSCIIIPVSGTNGGNSRLKSANLSSLERGVFREQNEARTNPKKYARKLEATLKYYSGNIFRRPGAIGIRTREGTRAVREAIRYLRRVSPRSAMKLSRGMSKACRDHVRDQGRRGTTGHYGSDRSSPFARMKRYGRYLSTAGENIGYGPKRADLVVMQLIIDDGVRSRGHRKNIFNPSFKVTGIACGSHRVYRNMCVITYAGGFIDN